MVELGLIQVVDVFLWYGVNFNFEDLVIYYMVLYIVVLWNQLDMVELLVYYGVDINWRDWIYESSFLDLVSEEFECLFCLQCFLDFGVDVNVVDKYGKIVLFYVLVSSDGVQIYNIENIWFLLEGGVDVKVIIKDGDIVFICIIFLFGEIVGGDKEEVQMINCFCF